jgi:ParB-like chromosome segregation protein Spo0J
VSLYVCQRLEIARLRPTEMVEAGHVARLAREMQRDGLQRRPLLVERASMAILDGHHRFHAAQELGLARICAVVIDYDDPRLELSSWSTRAYSRTEVLAAAESGVLLPAKSTRHVLTPPLGEAPVALADLEAVTAPSASAR